MGAWGGRLKNWSLSDRHVAYRVVAGPPYLNTVWVTRCSIRTHVWELIQSSGIEPVHLSVADSRLTPCKRGQFCQVIECESQRVHVHTYSRLLGKIPSGLSRNTERAATRAAGAKPNRTPRQGSLAPRSRGTSMTLAFNCRA